VFLQDASKAWTLGGVAVPTPLDQLGQSRRGLLGDLWSDAIYDHVLEDLYVGG